MSGSLPFFYTNVGTRDTHRADLILLKAASHYLVSTASEDESRSRHQISGRVVIAASKSSKPSLRSLSTTWAKSNGTRTS
jgi:hypothetical protein